MGVYDPGLSRRSAEEAHALRSHCQHFSRLGWALFGQAASALTVQILAIFLTGRLAPGLMHRAVFLWGLSVLSVYGVGFPVFCAVAGSAEAPPVAAPKRPLGPARFFQAYFIGLSVLYLANSITLLLLSLAELLRGQPVTNPVDSIQNYPVGLNLLLGCVIAPITEEFMFRRLLLDRLRPYGDLFAVLASALCFGLFHGNFNQFLYAFALGAVFGYIVLRTGCLWQTIVLHAMVNVIATGVSPLLGLLGERGEQLLGTLVLGSILLGVVFLAALRRELRFGPGRLGLSPGRTWRLFFENPGMLFFCLLALLEAVSFLIDFPGN